MIWPFNRKPPGQLADVERKYLYDLVRSSRPQVVVESGTWKGGGSTLFLASALSDNASGELHTWESHEPFYQEALRFYQRQRHLRDRVHLHLGDFVGAVERLSDVFVSGIGVVFLDGGDETPDGKLKLPLEQYPDSSENVRSFKALSPRLRSGTHLLLHDWGVQGGRGMFVRQVLEREGFGAWRIVEVLDTGTGMCHMMKG